MVIVVLGLDFENEWLSLFWREWKNTANKSIVPALPGGEVPNLSASGRRAPSVGHVISGERT